MFDEAVPPMFLPYKLGNLELENRVVVSPMSMYSATDGLPNVRDPRRPHGPPRHGEAILVALQYPRAAVVRHQGG